MVVFIDADDVAAQQVAQYAVWINIASDSESASCAHAGFLLFAPRCSGGEAQHALRGRHARRHEGMALHGSCHACTLGVLPLRLSSSNSLAGVCDVCVLRAGLLDHSRRRHSPALWCVARVPRCRVASRPRVTDLCVLSVMQAVCARPRSRPSTSCSSACAAVRRTRRYAVVLSGSVDAMLNFCGFTQLSPCLPVFPVCLFHAVDLPERDSPPHRRPAEHSGVNREAVDHESASQAFPSRVPCRLQWLKMAAFLVHGRQSCVDGRDDSGYVAVAAACDVLHGSPDARG